MGIDRFRVADGKMAMWMGAGDMLPFTTPLSYISRVKFHSDLDYLPIVSVIDRTVSLPEIPSTGSGQGSGGRRGLRTNLYTLAPHGMGFTPFVVGELSINGTVSGKPMVMAGSVPVAQVTNDHYARFLSLGADATNVTVYEYSPLRGFAPGNWVPRPAVNVTIRTYVSAVDLDSSVIPPLSSARFKIDATGMVAGRWSTANRYIREVANVSDAVLWAVDGPTIAISALDAVATWRWAMGNSITRAGASAPDNTPPPSVGFNTLKPIAL
jgi:hypothetical protein